MIIISTGSALDVAAIMPVMADAFDPMFNEAWTAAQCLATLSLQGSRLLIARHGEAVTGFALSRSVVDEEELLLIGVSNDYRRQGTGRKLILTLVDYASSQNIEAIFLEVRDGNAARRFYLEMGFAVIGKRPSYYRSTIGDYHDSITMALRL